MLGLNSLYVSVIAVLLGVCSTLFSYEYGYKKGDEAGFQRSEAACMLARQEAASILLASENKELVEASRAIADSIQASTERAKQLDKKIGALREQAKFTSHPDCKLSDDELRNLQRAYRVQEDSSGVPD